MEPNSPAAVPWAREAAALVKTSNAPAARGASSSEKSDKDPSSCPMESLQRSSSSTKEVQGDGGRPPRCINRADKARKDNMDKFGKQRPIADRNKKIWIVLHQSKARSCAQHAQRSPEALLTQLNWCTLTKSTIVRVNLRVSVWCSSPPSTAQCGTLSRASLVDLLPDLLILSISPSRALPSWLGVWVETDNSPKTLQSVDAFLRQQIWTTCAGSRWQNQGHGYNIFYPQTPSSRRQVERCNLHQICMWIESKQGQSTSYMTYRWWQQSSLSRRCWYSNCRLDTGQDAHQQCCIYPRRTIYDIGR